MKGVRDKFQKGLSLFIASSLTLCVIFGLTLATDVVPVHIHKLEHYFSCRCVRFDRSSHLQLTLKARIIPHPLWYLPIMIFQGEIYQFFSDKLFTFDAEQKILIVKKIYEEKRFGEIGSRFKMSRDIKTPKRHLFKPGKYRVVVEPMEVDTYGYKRHQFR